MNNSIAHKQFSGLLYGLFSGLALALATWGWDAFLLWQAHAILPWTRFSIGLAACLVAFSLAGWLTMWFEKVSLATLFWLLAALVPALLAPQLTFSLWPKLAPLLDPELTTRLTLPALESQGVFEAITAVIMGLAAMMIGILEVPLVEQSSFSTASGAMTGPILLAAFIFTLSGLFADNTMHVRLRNPLLSINRTLVFIAEHDMDKVDKLTTRQIHAGAFNEFKKVVKGPYRLIVTDYDNTFDQVNVLVDFNGTWGYCYTAAEQLSYCKPIP